MGDSIINPLTGRRIQVGGATHRKLVQYGGGNTINHHITNDSLKIEADGFVNAKAGDYLVYFKNPNPRIAKETVHTSFIEFPFGKWDKEELAHEFEMIAAKLRTSGKRMSKGNQVMYNQTGGNETAREYFYLQLKKALEKISDDEQTITLTIPIFMFPEYYYDILDTLSKYFSDVKFKGIDRSDPKLTKTMYDYKGRVSGGLPRIVSTTFTATPDQAHDYLQSELSDLKLPRLDLRLTSFGK